MPHGITIPLTGAAGAALLSAILLPSPFTQALTTSTSIFCIGHMHSKLIRQLTIILYNIGLCTPFTPPFLTLLIFIEDTSAVLPHPLLPTFFFLQTPLTFLLQKLTFGQEQHQQTQTHHQAPIMSTQECPTAPRHDLTNLVTLLELLLISGESALGAVNTSTHANHFLVQENLHFYCRNELLAKNTTSNFGTPLEPLHQHTRVP